MTNAKKVTCPACGRLIAKSVFGHLWRHNNKDGANCFMSGRLLRMENVELENAEERWRPR